MTAQPPIFKIILIVWVTLSLSTIVGCSFHKRRGYDRSIAAYPKPNYNGNKDSKSVKGKTTQTKKRYHTKRAKHSGALETIIKPWLGTPYLFGGESKRGIDCSAFVMHVFRKYRGINLPHSTRQTFKMGKKIAKSDLKKGDVIFFGNWIGVNHSAIYMGNGTFAHASSSRGVIYTKMTSTYWAPKYKGARRY
ncbi:MAG: C40 family peptidase [Fibrobacterales bacterium]